MVKKLYVGGLSWGTTEDGLKAAFSQAGNVVSAIVIKDKFSGKSKGFGFVEMEEADAQVAIDMWNNKVLDDRTIIVNEARPMTERPPRDNYNRRQGGSFGGGDRY